MLKPRVFLNLKSVNRLSKVCFSTDKTSGGERSSDTGPPPKPIYSGPTLYDYRKYGHPLPQDTTPAMFEMLPNFPSGVFRCTIGEVLGPCADKCTFYKNPEYFAYHHMTYFDMHLLLRSSRLPSPVTNRKP